MRQGGSAGKHRGLEFIDPKVRKDKVALRESVGWKQITLRTLTKVPIGKRDSLLTVKMLPRVRRLSGHQEDYVEWSNPRSGSRGR